MASAEPNCIPFTTDRGQQFSSKVQSYYRLIGSVSALVLDSLDKVSPTPGQPFVIGDYGTADGGTSYSLLQEIIALLRNKYGADLPIQVVYEDQPFNQFTPLFLRAQGLIPGIPSLTSQFSNVYVSASGCSFFSQCVPPNSIDFIVCFCSVHWLSRSPESNSPTLFPTQNNGPARQAFKKQAEEDWETFLFMRGKELKHGGRMVVTSLSSSTDGSAAENVLSITTRVWQGMLDNALINTVEFNQTQFAFHLRSREELEKPFKDGKSPVSVSGLKLVCMERQTVRVFLDQHTDDLTQARMFTDEIRTWQEATLLRGLSDIRSTEEKLTIINTFYERFFDLAVRDSVSLSPYYRQNVLVIRKD